MKYVQYELRQLSSKAPGRKKAKPCQRNDSTFNPCPFQRVRFYGHFGFTPSQRYRTSPLDRSLVQLNNNDSQIQPLSSRSPSKPPPSLAGPDAVGGDARKWSGLPILPELQLFSDARPQLQDTNLQAAIMSHHERQSKVRPAAVASRPSATLTLAPEAKDGTQWPPGPDVVQALGQLHPRPGRQGLDRLRRHPQQHPDQVSGAARLPPRRGRRS